jgi:DnaJ homolog subfamily A member 5
MKVAFRKLAMKLHPDKNTVDPLAKEKFQELNEAYEVLKDPNERAWYDSHRDQILRGDIDGE